MRPWYWDASTSPDVLAYILSLVLMRVTGSITICDVECIEYPTYEVRPAIDVAETPDTFIEYDPPGPLVGECWFVDVNAVDLAGNRSID